MPGAPPPTPPRGERFGKFIRTDWLGEGGMGQVWRGWDTELERWVALKFLRGGEAELARFAREARLAGRLNHPHIAAIYEFVPDDPPYIAMQFIDGVTIDEATELDRTAQVRCIRDAALALHDAHREGVIHRDVKPENLMVTPGGAHCYVMDFGLARATAVADGISKSGSVVGTVNYMPPEQARGDPVDARADVYALGATLYDLLTGSPPFAGGSMHAVLMRLLSEDPPPPRQRDASVPPDLAIIAMHCLSKEPARRYATAADLADDLTRWLEGRPITARAPSAGYRLRRWIGRHRAAVVAGALGVAAVAVLAAVLGPGWLAAARRAEQQRQAAATAQAARLAELEARERARAFLGNGQRMLEELLLLVRRTDYPRSAVDTLAERARAEFRRALEQDPASAEAWTGIGRAWVFTAEPQHALSAFDAAVAASPTYAPAYLERARLLALAYDALRSDAHGGAVPETAKARALRTRIEADLAAVRARAHDDAAVRAADGVLAYAVGDWATAAGHFEAYLQVAPNDHHVHYLHGRALQQLGRWADADEAFAHALACLDRNPHVRAARAFGLTRLGRPDAALAEAERACTGDPNHASAHLVRAIALAQLRRFDASLAAYGRSFELRAPAPTGLCDRAATYRAMGRPADALADYDRALELDPDHWPALTNRAMLRAAAGRTAAAQADAEHAVAAHPESAACWATRGQLRLRARDWAGALADGRAAVARDPQLTSAWMLQGTAWLQLGRTAEAVRALDAAVAAAPDNPKALYTRAIARRRAGDVAGAIADYARVLEVAPPDWPFRGRAETWLARLRSGG